MCSHWPHKLTWRAFFCTVIAAFTFTALMNSDLGSGLSPGGSVVRDALVLNKWFSVQAGCDRPGLLDDVKALVEHPDFTWTNPNRMRSVVSVFAGNLPHFHAEGGAAYAWLGDVVEKVGAVHVEASTHSVHFHREARLARRQGSAREGRGGCSAHVTLSSRRVRPKRAAPRGTPAPM